VLLHRRQIPPLGFRQRKRSHRLCARNACPDGDLWSDRSHRYPQMEAHWRTSLSEEKKAGAAPFKLGHYPAASLIGQRCAEPQISPAMRFDHHHSGSRWAASPICPGLIFKAQRLTEVFWQAARSRIVISAHKIKQGLIPDLSKPESDSDFVHADVPETAGRSKDLATVF
jgi:hypothetical protein